MSGPLRIAALVLLAVGIARGYTVVTVQGNVTDPRIGPVAGSCTVQMVERTSGLLSGIRSLGAPVVVSVTAGYLSYDTVAGNSYRLYCRIPQQQISGSWLAAFSFGPIYWSVPSEATGTLDIQDVEVSELGDLPTGGGGGGTSDASATDTVTLSGGQSTFTLAHIPTSGSLNCYQNGLRSTDVSLAASTVTLSYPVNGDVWVCDYRYVPSGSASIGTPNIESFTPITTTVTLAYAPLSGTLRTWLNGARQAQTLDYTLSGTTVTLPTAPASGEIWTFSYER